MSWNLSKREFEKLRTEFQEEISNSNFGFNLGEISEKLQNLLLNRAFTNLFYDESLYICSQGRLTLIIQKFKTLLAAFFISLIEIVMSINLQLNILLLKR